MLLFKTVDSILANFKNQIEDLQALEVKHLDQAALANEAIVSLQKAKKFNEDEAERASAVAKRLEALIK